MLRPSYLPKCYSISTFILTQIIADSEMVESTFVNCNAAYDFKKALEIQCVDVNGLI